MLDLQAAMEVRNCARINAPESLVLPVLSHNEMEQKSVKGQQNSRGKADCLTAVDRCFEMCCGRLLVLESVESSRSVRIQRSGRRGAPGQVMLLRWKRGCGECSKRRLEGGGL